MVCMVIACMPSIALGVEAEPVLQNGPSENRIDVVVLAEGYTASQASDARADIGRFLTGIQQWEPLQAFGVHFNWWLVPLVSDEEGADHPSRGEYADTALDATYDYYDIERLLVVSQQKAVAAASEAFAAYDYIMVMVNDPQYGGSGGEIAVFSVHEAAPLIAVHEFGHTHGGLADEYEDPYPGFPEGDWEPNVTFASERDNVPWKVWIDASTPVPTPENWQYQTVAGLFEGARYKTSGVYRPRYTCMMRELDEPFCEVCREAMVLEDYRYVRSYDGILPEDDAVVIQAGERRTFSVDALQPLGTPSVAVSWFIDNVPVSGQSEDLEVTYSDFSDAQVHTVVAEVRDQTAFVRTDPENLTMYTVQWAVTLDDTPVDGDLDTDPDIDEIAIDGDEPDDDPVDDMDLDEDTVEIDHIQESEIEADTESDVESADITDTIETDAVGEIDAPDSADGDTADAADGADVNDGTGIENNNTSDSGCAQGLGWVWLLAACIAGYRRRKRHCPC